MNRFNHDDKRPAPLTKFQGYRNPDEVLPPETGRKKSKSGIHISFGNHTVENRFLKFLITLLVLLFLAGFLVLLFGVFLPLLGIMVGLSIGLVGIVLAVLAVLSPLLFFIYLIVSMFKAKRKG